MGTGKTAARNNYAPVADYEAIRCGYCCDVVDPLEVFPTGPLVAGSACLGCYRVHVLEKRSDAENFSAMMSAFGGGAVRR